MALFNIVFAWLGFLCLIMPFVFVIKDNKKTWCQSYCPRSNLFTNLLMIFLSAFMVILDKRDPLEKVRFLIAFQLPWNMPNLLDIGVMPDWVVHLGFRAYSMMITTTVIGLLVGYLYRPKPWCVICPMGTLSSLALRTGRKSGLCFPYSAHAGRVNRGNSVYPHAS